MRSDLVGIRLVGSSGSLVSPLRWLLQLVGYSSWLAPPGLRPPHWFLQLVGLCCWVLVVGSSVLLAPVDDLSVSLALVGWYSYLLAIL